MSNSRNVFFWGGKYSTIPCCTSLYCCMQIKWNFNMLQFHQVEMDGITKWRNPTGMKIYLSLAMQTQSRNANSVEWSLNKRKLRTTWIPLSATASFNFTKCVRHALLSKGDSFISSAFWYTLLSNWATSNICFIL